MTDEVSASGKQCSLVNFISHFNDNRSCMFYLTRVIDFALRYINTVVQKHAPPSRSYADALRHRLRQSAGNRRRSHTQRASHRNPRPTSSNQRRGADAITGTGSFGVLKSTGRGLEKCQQTKTAQLHGNVCYMTGEKHPTAGRDTTHRTGDGD